MNGNDFLEWEEQNAERLTEEFLRKYAQEWTDFVMEDYNNRGQEDEDDR